MNMPDVTVHRYDAAPVAGFIGYIEPADRSWILYVAEDGEPHFYPHRADDGRVICRVITRDDVARMPHIGAPQ